MPPELTAAGVSFHSVERASGRQAFVEMFSRLSPASQLLREAVADQRHGPVKVLEIDGRTALLWPGYDLSLHTLAMDMMHADFELVTGLLGYPDTVQVLNDRADTVRLRRIDLSEVVPAAADNT
jgi:predicted dehydrogenase